MLLVTTITSKLRHSFQAVEKVSTLLVILVFVLAVLLSSITIMAQEKTAELQVLEGHNQFANNLYQVLSKKEGNVFFSPISAHAVLSMAYQGAEGSTAEKFSTSLKIADAKSAADGYKDIISGINKVQDITLLMANKIFLQDTATLINNFKTAVTDSFLSDVQLLNFGENAAAAKTINDWVEEQTRNKIKDLISANDLNALTRLVLVNAIYFKGNWLHKFDENRTQTEPFYLNEKDTVDVRMMHIKNKFRYADSEELNAQVLELPYVNKNLSMIIILPKEKNGIKDLETKLANASLSDIAKKLWSTEVNVALPKFKIEETINLNDPLSQLGLGEIFDENKANFKGMIELKPNENLYVSKVVQKAFIEVNEEGAEAAAATGVVMMMRCSLPVSRPVVEFKADHPFIYILAQKSKINNPLFFGRISKLTA